MGRAPSSVSGEGELNKGPWTEEEDALLAAFIKANGEGNWRTLPKRAGLQRCRKSCRLRWMNYLRPDLKRGNFSPDEDELIIKLHTLLGNRWSMIAGRIPGRTDNEIKNYWNSRLRRKLNPTSSGRDVTGQLLKATPVSFAAPQKPEFFPASSTQTGDVSTPAVTGSGDAEVGTAIPDYDAALADSSSLFLEYVRFDGTDPSGEATPSEPSSEGTCLEESCDHYYSAWTPALAEVAEDQMSTQAVSVKRELYSYSPESSTVRNSMDDFSSIDFGSFSTLSDSFGETNVHRLLLSPIQKNLVPSPWSGCYSGDGIW